MKDSIKTWLNFGAISGVITTLWLMVWLAFASESYMIVIGWILTIAIADSLSDALWIHVSEESKNQNNKEVWVATIITFVAKFLFAMSFIIPILIFSLHTAVLVSAIWWLLIVTLISYKIAKNRWEKPLHTILEHVGITILVIVLTYLVWIWISNKFWV